MLNVITLLKDMLNRMKEEAEEDEEKFDKLGCWCQTYDKAKTKAMAEVEAHIEAL